ncbi:MAG: hypothetical protein PHN68_02030 [Prolixibacteraceae bacterium]|jgi:hypothetical protein|nr:hypothetical protein [Prolixibacteraceae bacterium]MDD4754504.1 hypothetical protein [Prolixibacteraceae bacterium]NLO01304.1 hypothetical protein [Bacteroidales bacterium]
MNHFEKDIKLRQLLKTITPESPGPDFSNRVMKSIFEEQFSLEQLKKYPVLKKSFWVFLSLFAILIAIAVVLSIISGTYPDQSTLQNFGMDKILTGYQSFLTQLGTLPVSIASILTATSLLVLMELLFDKKFGG